MMYNPQRTFVRVFGGKSALQPNGLVRWQLFLGGFLALQAVALLTLSVAYELPVYVAHLTGDVLQAKLTGKPEVALAFTDLFRLNLAYLLAVALLVAALLSLFFATVYRGRYVAMVKRGWQPLRWLLLAANGSLLLVVLCLLAGIREVVALLVIVGAMAAAGIAGALFEQLPVRRGQPRLLRMLAGAVAITLIVLPLFVIGLVMAATNIFGSVATPSYVWWLFVTLGAAAIFLGMNAGLTLRKLGKWSNYAYSERWVLIVAALINTAFVWQVFAAVLHP